MSTLYIDNITGAGVSQSFRLKNNVSLYAIRCNLMKYGTPTGGLTITIYENTTAVYTQTIPMSELNALTGGTYSYGMFLFELNKPLKKQGEYTEYTIELASTIYDENNYYAWNSDYMKLYTNLYGSNQTGGEADNILARPFKFELMEYKG